MSLPPFPSFSGLKPSELHVYTIEECQNCKQKTKRDFKVGDYIAGTAGICEKCQGQKIVILVYGEKVLPQGRNWVGRSSPRSSLEYSDERSGPIFSR